MLNVNEKITRELKRVKAIMKDLVNNHQSEEKKISNVFTRYKAFLEDNKDLIRRKYDFFNELVVVESKLNLYYDVSNSREKRSLLNDAYVGLLFDVSEAIEELEEMRMEESLAEVA